MKQSPYDFIRQQREMQFATKAGTSMHERLRKIIIEDQDIRGDVELIERIQQNVQLSAYFRRTARTEVPIAGTMNGRFISRRIDRMVIDEKAKIIKILDYKTDTQRTMRRDKYKAQLHEYCNLLHQIYPEFAISAAILWTHDWTLETI